MSNISPTREPLPVCLVAMCVGIVVDQLLDLSLFVWGILFLCFAVTWLYRNTHLCLRIRSNQKHSLITLQYTNSERRIFVSTMILIAMIISSSAFWHQLYWNYYPANDVGNFQFDEPTPIVLEGNVVTAPRWIPAVPDDPGRLIAPTDQTVMTIRVTNVRNGRTWQPSSGYVRLSVGGKLPGVHYGDQLQIIGEISSPNIPKNPGDYDQAASLREQRILALLRARAAESITLLKQGTLSPGRSLELLRNSAHANMKKYMSRKHSAFASAMILGVRDEVEPELTQILLESGVAHIISISGMHVGLIALGFIMFFRMFGLRRKWLASALVVTIFSYLLITDVRPAAIRATLLVFVASLAMFRNQRRMQLNAFAATGIAVLILNPSNLFQVGTQLSYLATGVFLWFEKPFNFFGWFKKKPIPLDEIEQREQELRELEERERQLLRANWFSMLRFGVALFLRHNINALYNTLIISTVIWCIVSPLIIAQMHVFSPIAILINPLLWVPLMLALLSGFAVMITGWFCAPLAIVFGKIADLSYQLLTALIAWFHSMPYSYYWVPGLHHWWLIGLYLPLIFWTLFPKTRPSTRLIICLGICWSLVVPTVHYLQCWNDRRNDRMYVRVLAVGHGLSIHIKMPDGHSLLYDVGCISSPYKGAQVATESLWDTGTRNLDELMISHPDSDHFNGVPHLLEKINVKRAYVTPYMFRKDNAAIKTTHDALIKQGIPITELVQGDSLSKIGYPNIRILHPSPITEYQESTNSFDSNSNSMVVLIEHRGHRVLLTGDIEDEQSLSFLQEPPLHVDLMVSPHHGSINQTADHLVDWATPEYIAISGGLFTYNPKTKPHFEEKGCKVYSTLQNGMIELIIDRHGTHIRPFIQ